MQGSGGRLSEGQFDMNSAAALNIQLGGELGQMTDKFGNPQPTIPGSLATANGVQKTATENVIRFRDREYQFYGKGIISDEQAMEIFDKLLNEKKDPAQSQRTLTQWKDDETHLF